MTVLRRPLRIALDARLVGGQSGGVEQAILGLAYGLSRLTDGDEEYYFLTLPGKAAWLQPYVSGPCRLVTLPAEQRPPLWRERLKSVPGLKSLWHRLTPVIGPAAVRVPSSDGQIEALSIDLMHFTFQAGFFTSIPTIYQPWDMQHRHWPQYFTAHERLARDVVYNALCRQARLVIVASGWTRRDVIQQLGLPETQVQVVPMAAPIVAAARLQAKMRPVDLPQSFVLYPAQTWPHKNHLKLLEALAWLREQHGLRLPLVCVGRQNPRFFSQIKQRVRVLKLEGQVIFPGYYWPLTEFYARARCVVFPSRFEGFGMPVVEAFAAGVPLASSTATCLPELVGDAGLLFDPDDVQGMGEAMRRLWLDDRLRTTLIARGYARAQNFSWEKTARLYRAHYRRLIHGRVSLSDQMILESPSPV